MPQSVALPPRTNAVWATAVSDYGESDPSVTNVVAGAARFALASTPGEGVTRFILHWGTNTYSVPAISGTATVAFPPPPVVLTNIVLSLSASGFCSVTNPTAPVGFFRGWIQRADTLAGPWSNWQPLNVSITITNF